MKQYPGYTLVKHEDCPEQHGTLTVLTHDVSGAAVLLVENDDDNKAFGIGFGTFPSDDTGVFHILEHSVLAGSEKYLRHVFCLNLRPDHMPAIFLCNLHFQIRERCST